MSPFNQFLCRADGKERFSRSDCTIEIQIFIVFIKSINEMAADPHRAAETFQRLALIVVERQKTEVVFPEKFTQMRLVI